MFLLSFVLSHLFFSFFILFAIIFWCFGRCWCDFYCFNIYRGYSSFYSILLRLAVFIICILFGIFYLIIQIWLPTYQLIFPFSLLKFFFCNFVCFILNFFKSKFNNNLFTPTLVFFLFLASSVDLSFSHLFVRLLV